MATKWVIPAAPELGEFKSYAEAQAAMPGAMIVSSGFVSGDTGSNEAVTWTSRTGQDVGPNGQLPGDAQVKPWTRQQGDNGSLWGTVMDLAPIWGGVLAGGALAGAYGGTAGALGAGGNVGWGAALGAGEAGAGLGAAGASTTGGAMGGIGDWFSSLFGGGGSSGGGLSSLGGADYLAELEASGAAGGPAAGGAFTSIPAEQIIGGGLGWSDVLNGGRLAGNFLGGGSGVGAGLGALAGYLGSRGAPTSLSTTNEPWSGAIGPLLNLTGNASQYVNSPLPYANATDMVAPLNANQNAGFAGGLDWASALAKPTMDNAFSNINPILSGSLMNVDSNPYLRAAIDAATAPITDAYNGPVQQNIRGNFNSGGATGSSRRGIAEGIAGREYMRNVGNVSSSMASTGYGQGLNATSQFYGMLPNLLNASTAPWQTALNIGNQQQQNDQAMRAAPGQLDAMKAQRLTLGSNVIGNAARGGSTTTAPAPYQSPWLTALGGGLAGSQIGRYV